MIQDIGAGRFHNEYRLVQPGVESRVLFYRGRELFVKRQGDGISFLTYGEVIRHFPMLRGRETYLFSLDNVNYYLFRDADRMRVRDCGERNRRTEESRDAQLCDGQAAEERKILHCSGQEDGEEPEVLHCDEQMGFAVERSLTEAVEIFSEYTWEKIEILRTVSSREEAFAGVTGMQLYSWYASRRFCPRCGETMKHDGKERMMRCPSCGQVEYPKICPAVIVGVINGDRLLLTKYAGRTNKRYALIAGFAEIGETIEETVQREVMEEVGLKVKNIRYYKSQPWSFSDTLLMGFFADLDGAENICLDETELSEGKWCTREEIPEDDGISLTREMMRMFREGKVR